jgi:hypothetical protein
MRKARSVKIAIVTLILATGSGALALAGFSASADNGHNFHGVPVPALFAPNQLRTVDATVKEAEARGHRVAKEWLDTHPVATDAQFARWALRAVGSPPGGDAPPSELAQLRTIASQRTSAGVTAATWLESHGKKQPWKAIRNQTETFATPAAEQQTKDLLSSTFDLGGTIEDTAKARYDRPSPYVTDPSLNAGGVRVDTGGEHQSYPSSHMVDAGIGTALLTQLDPNMRSEYEWMADEIAYSRLYAGGHYISDVKAGAFLGTLIGDYALHKAGLAS